ncbi:MAG: hypothetical protein ABI472_22235, partial [Ginsengibacter sp.]
MKKILQPVIIIVFIFSFLTTSGQQEDGDKHMPADTVIQLMPKEFWWGGAVTFGNKMPLGKEKFSFNLNG